MKARTLLTCFIMLWSASAAAQWEGYRSNPRCNCAMCQFLRQRESQQWRAQVIVKAATQSTPMEDVKRILAEMNLQPSDVLYDIGCGDGRYLIEAARTYRCRAVGIDSDRSIASATWRRVRELALSDRIAIYHGDGRTADLSDATAVVMYLYPETLAEILPRLEHVRVIASYRHPLPRSSEYPASAGHFYMRDNRPVLALQESVPLLEANQ